MPNSGSWRIPIGLQIIWGIMLMLGAAILPESPRLLLGKGKQEAALKSIAALNDCNTEDPLAREIYDDLEEAVAAENADGQASWLECFSTRSMMWKRTLNGMMIQFLQQVGWALSHLGNLTDAGTFKSHLIGLLCFLFSGRYIAHISLCASWLTIHFLTSYSSTARISTTTTDRCSSRPRGLKLSTRTRSKCSWVVFHSPWSFPLCGQFNMWAVASRCSSVPPSWLAVRLSPVLSGISSPTVQMSLQARSAWAETSWWRLHFFTCRLSVSSGDRPRGFWWCRPTA